MIIDYKKYREKVYGCWLGKTIAGNMGGPLEDCRMIMDFDSVRSFAPVQMFANDDLDLQLVWLDVLVEKGLDFTSHDLMNAFRRCYPISPNEYGYSKRNDARGIRPPLSGTYENAFFMHSMGCPIRSEVWAMIAPGQPKLAIDLAGRDGCLDHGSESIYAEQYLAAVESLAFVEDCLEVLLKKGLDYIPADSQISRIISWAITCFNQSHSWKEAVEALHRYYGHNDSSTVFYNIGVEILALLYGCGDFDRTVTLAVNGGYDTDCTAATVGAVLGVIYGGGIIDPYWRELAGDEIKTMCRNLKSDLTTFDKLTDLTCRIGYTAGVKNCAVHWTGTDEAARIKLGRHADWLAFKIHYIEGAQISPGESKNVNVEIINRSGCSVDISIKIDAAENLLCQKIDYCISGREDKQRKLLYVPSEGQTSDAITGNIHIDSENTCLLTFCVGCIPENGYMNECNLFKLICSDQSSQLPPMAFDFGLVGRPVWKIHGPFRNLYNFKRIPKERREKEAAWFNIPSENIYRYYDLAEAHNHFVYLDEAYMDESAECFEAYWQQGAIFMPSGDTLRIDEMTTFGGACCMYAFQKFDEQSEGIAEFHVGSTSPYIIWLNGEMLFSQAQSNGYSPYTDVFRGELKAGENLLAVKLLRYHQGQAWTMVIRQSPFGLGGDIKTGWRWHTGSGASAVQVNSNMEVTEQ